MAKKSKKPDNIVIKIENNVQSKNKPIIEDWHGDDSDDNDNDHYLFRRGRSWIQTNDNYLNNQLYTLRDMIANNQNLNPNQIDMFANNAQQNAEQFGSEISRSASEITDNTFNRNQLSNEIARDYITNFKPQGVSIDEYIRMYSGRGKTKIMSERMKDYLNCILNFALRSLNLDVALDKSRQ